eukprot:scaffold15143_cov103-Isochrysis_galbana.AAC.5
MLQRSGGLACSRWLCHGMRGNGSGVDTVPGLVALLHTGPAEHTVGVARNECRSLLHRTAEFKRDGRWRSQESGGTKQNQE